MPFAGGVFCVSTDQSQNYLFVFAAMENHIRSISIMVPWYHSHGFTMVYICCVVIFDVILPAVRYN